MAGLWGAGAAQGEGRATDCGGASIGGTILLLPAMLVSAVGRKPLGAVYVWKGWVLQPAPLLLAEALVAAHGSGAGVCW